MKRNKNGFLDYLKEISIVVVGVLIAVSIGNYKEKLENEAYLKKTFSTIESEISTSQKDLENVLIRHQQLLTKLQSNIGNNELTIAEFVSKSGGFQIASTKNLSLRFFVSNKAELLNFEVISYLLDIEMKTDILKNKIERLTSFVYEHFDDNDTKAFTEFSLLLAEVIDSEVTLSETYDDFLEKNEFYFINENP